MRASIVSVILAAGLGFGCDDSAKGGEGPSGTGGAIPVEDGGRDAGTPLDVGITPDADKEGDAAALADAASGADAAQGPVDAAQGPVDAAQGPADAAQGPADAAHPPGDAAGPDGDGDGIHDEADNCADVANPQQADIDGDGAGDACDEEPQRFNHRLRHVGLMQVGGFVMGAQGDIQGGATQGAQTATSGQLQLRGRLGP
jgi:hypothetical protein